MTGLNRRTVKKIASTMTPEEVYHSIKSEPLESAALVAFITVTAARVSEATRVRRSQFVFDIEPGFVLIKDFIVSKKRRGKVRRDEVAMPLKGSLGNLTNLFISYFQSLAEGQEKVFPFSTRTAYRRVNRATGLWPHYFRSVAENTWLTLFRGDVMRLAKYLNVDTRSMEDYVKSNWRDYSAYILAGG